MGEVFAGHYELVDLVGAGSTGEVWRAWDHRQQTYVSAKVMRQHDAAGLVRFVREHSESLRHPHVLLPRAWAGAEEQVLFAADLVRGGSVADLLAEQGSLPVFLVAQLAEQVLSALSAVHDRGLVHRDVRSGRVLLEPTGSERPHCWLSGFSAVTVDQPDEDLRQVGRMVVELVTGTYPRKDGESGTALARLPAEFRTWTQRLVGDVGLAGDLDSSIAAFATADEARAELLAIGLIPRTWPTSAPHVPDRLGGLPVGWAPDGPGVVGAGRPVASASPVPVGAAEPSGVVAYEEIPPLPHVVPPVTSALSDEDVPDDDGFAELAELPPADPAYADSAVLPDEPLSELLPAGRPEPFPAAPAETGQPDPPEPSQQSGPTVQSGPSATGSPDVGPPGVGRIEPERDLPASDPTDSDPTDSDPAESDPAESDPADSDRTNSDLADRGRHAPVPDETDRAAPDRAAPDPDPDDPDPDDLVEPDLSGRSAPTEAAPNHPGARPGENVPEWGRGTPARSGTRPGVTPPVEPDDADDQDDAEEFQSRPIRVPHPPRGARPSEELATPTGSVASPESAEPTVQPAARAEQPMWHTGEWPAAERPPAARTGQPTTQQTGQVTGPAESERSGGPGQPAAETAPEVQPAVGDRAVEALSAGEHAGADRRSAQAGWTGGDHPDRERPDPGQWQWPRDPASTPVGPTPDLPPLDLEETEPSRWRRVLLVLFAIVALVGAVAGTWYLVVRYR